MLTVEKWDISKYGDLNEQNLLNMFMKQGYEAGRRELDAGAVFPDHTHDTHKMLCILSGQMKFGMHGEEAVIGNGDAVVVPRNTVHWAVIGESSPAIIYEAMY